MLNITLNTDSVSLFDILKNIGLGGWFIIIVILILSFISVYIFVERVMAIKKASKREKNVHRSCFYNLNPYVIRYNKLSIGNSNIVFSQFFLCQFRIKKFF